jgi:hypothetical protein
MPLVNLLVHASVPGTGGPAVGLPPAPATNSKASGTQPATSEVYLMWDDEAMSMVLFRNLFFFLTYRSYGVTWEFGRLSRLQA